MEPRTSAQIFDEIAQQQTRKEVDLSSGILSKARKEKSAKMKSRFVLSGITAIAIIAAVLFTIPSVATAMRRLLGYIPGIGLVENDVQLRILKEPVQTKQGDTILTVVQGVVDTQHTTLVYQVEAIPASSANAETKAIDECRQLPELLLPDGSPLKGQVEQGNSWVSGYSRRILYPTLPGDVNAARLVFPCLEQTTPAPDVQKWEVTLNFEDAPADIKVYPLVDLPTPMPEPTRQAKEEGSNASDITLILNRFVQTDENLILFGALESWSGSTRIGGVGDDSIHLLDANGKDIPLAYDPSLTAPEDENPNGASFKWAYQTAGNYSPGKGTLIVNSVWARLNESIAFTFDPGPDPKPDQEWILNQELSLGGRVVTIQSVRMSQKGDGLSLTIKAPEDISDITLEDMEHVLLPGGGGPGSYGFTYRDGFPSGKITVTITGASLAIPGPWKLSVDLPALVNGDQPLETTGACLTQASWHAALKERPAIPEGMDSILTAIPGELDRQLQAAGDSGALSPDGRQFIYESGSGLQRRDLVSGNTTPLPDTGKNDRGVLWSPDGTRIAFTRGPASGLIGAPGPYSLYIANPDGTQQHPLLVNADANTAMAWLPDGQRLVYTVKGPDGSAVRSINVKNGQVTPLFDIHYTVASVAVSPDGKKAAYEEMLPGDHYGIYTANLDGSNPRLIADAAPIVAVAPQWSPDGKWLIATVYDDDLPAGSPVKALINVATCQVIPLL